MVAVASSSHTARHKVLNFFGVNTANGSFVAHFGVACLCIKLRNCQNITFIAQHQAVAFQMSAHAFNFANHAAAVNNFAAGRNGAGNRFGSRPR